MGVVNTNPDVRDERHLRPVRARCAGQSAFSSQSGALGIELLGRAAGLGLGISTFVSVGNKADVSGNDLLQYWEHDPDTDVILLYLESFGNPRKFARLARRVAPHQADRRGEERPHAARARGPRRRTPLRSRSSDVAVDALFRQAGVIRVDTLERAVRRRAGRSRTSRSRRAARRDRQRTAAARASSPPTRATARASRCPSSSPATQAALRALRRHRRRGRATRSTSSRRPPRRPTSARCARCSPTTSVDAVLVIFVPPLVTRLRRRGARRSSPRPRDARGQADRRVLPRTQRHAPDDRSTPHDARPAADPVVRVPGVGRRRARPRGRATRDGGGGPRGRFPTSPASTRPARERSSPSALAASPTACWLDAGRRPRRCARCFGIAVVRLAARRDRRRSRGAPPTSSAFPSRSRRESGAIVHKTDVGGVALGPRRRRSRACRRSTRCRRASATRWVAPSCSRWSTPGVETIVGVTQRSALRPARAVRDGRHRRRAGARHGAAASSRSPTRRARAGPLAALVAAAVRLPRRAAGRRRRARGDLLLRVGTLADELPEVAELDCNPVIVSPEARPSST